MQTKEQEEAIERLKSIENEVGELKKIINNKTPDQFTSYDSIRTYEDACLYLNEEPIKESDFYFLKDENKIKRAIADVKLCTIYKSINQIIGFKVNWKDKNQKKWYPYFNLSSVSGGVVLDRCSCGTWRSTVGSRLCTKNEKVAKYIGEQFVDLYADWLFE